MTLPPFQRLYTGPAVPQVYDPLWQGYTNLTPTQIVAFQQFPQALVIYSQLRRWGAEISGITAAGIPLNTQDRDQQKIAGLKQAFDTGALTGTVSFFDAAGNVQTVDVVAATALHKAVVSFVAQTYNTAATLQAAINATPPTVTTRAQIDAAYAAIAPNSPSAKGAG